jgi:hypothetical protein
MRVIPTAAALMFCASIPSFAQQNASDQAMNNQNTVSNQDNSSYAAMQNLNAQYRAVPPIYTPRRARMTPGPGTEEALRHQIAAIEAGQPDYHALSTGTANQLRYQVARIQPALSRQWGTFVSLQFLGGTARGADIYEARFEHAQVRWEIGSLDGHGKITAIAFKTLDQSGEPPS